MYKLIKSRADYLYKTEHVIYLAKLPTLLMSCTVNLQLPAPSFITLPLYSCYLWLVLMNLILQCIPKCNNTYSISLRISS
nr:MAG TPA: hypothetical protein [Caudoviricetes sp.]